MTNDKNKKNIEVLSSENRKFNADKNLHTQENLKNFAEYEKIYKHSIENTEEFWAEMADEHLSWDKKWDKVFIGNFSNSFKWFVNGKINASYNCLDRHINNQTRNKAALIWESDNGTYKTFTYQQLFYEVNKFANVLKKHGVKKGDAVAIYLPMIPELVIATLACARIGAIHAVVFGGFSWQALKSRIQDCHPKLLITADRGLRGGRQVPLKSNADLALQECPSVEKVIVVKTNSQRVDMLPGRDLCWAREMQDPNIANYCEPEIMDANDPLFILYTSGSTGKPKGIVHSTGGYLLYAHLTFKWIFDYRDGDINFCTADIGWITGHSYIIYGPMSNGATSLMFEGMPTYPAPNRLWEIVDKHRANIFYTAPTTIRALMKEGVKWVEKHDLSSLRVLGSVGEPINPEAWMWYHTHVGKGKLSIVDTWWQTETGGVLITPISGIMTLKPGSASKPFPGIIPKIIKEDGSPAAANEGGYLVIEKPWPGLMQGFYNDPDNTKANELYYMRFANKYLTGDGARIDEDGDYWLMGRIDDVLNVSGHRLGTSEIESSLVAHEAVAEAAVVGFPHEIKGEGIYAYVTLKNGFKKSAELQKILIGHIRTNISPIAKPDKLQFVTALPKTRSGKIMRRILRNIACGKIDDLGDTSTLADPEVVEEIIKERL